MKATTPRRWRSGTEPRFARSDLKLRFLLSVIFTPCFALMTAAFAVFAARADAASVPSRGRWSVSPSPASCSPSSP